MKSLSASLVTVALLAAGASAQFQINTPLPPPTQCVPVKLTWTGGTAPYFLAITPGGQTAASALQQYQGLTGTDFTWSTNISAGTSIGLSLTDATGTTVQSAPVTIQSGPDSSCLNGQASSATGSTAAGTSAAGTSAAGTSAAGTSSAAGTTGTSTAPSSGTTSRASGTSSGSSSSASATGGASGSNGAISNVASAGIVGVLGAVAAALLA